MNEQLSSCLCLLVHICSVSVLCPVLPLPAPVPFSRLAPVDSAPALLAVMVLVVVAHPLMSKLLICALPWLSAVCCLGCSSRLVPGPFDLSVFPSDGCDINIGLLLPWTTMHFQTHPPHLLHPHPSKSWLAVAMTTSCCPALPLPACSACGTLPCPCPVPIGDCPPVRCLWLTVLRGMV